jgi:hypothetical protein
MNINSTNVLWLPLFISCTQEGTEVQKFNLAPSVSIQSPEEGAYFDERSEIVFEALISDNADDPEFLTIVWGSDLQGDLGGTGVIDDAGYLIFPTSALQYIKNNDFESGTHTITLTVTDSEGETGMDTVLVNLNDMPDDAFLQLIHPQPNEIGRSDMPIYFELQINTEYDDVFEMTLSFLSDHEDLVSSASQGQFCVPIPTQDNTAYCSAMMPEGIHNLSFSALGSDGQTATIYHEFEVRHPLDIDDDGDGYSENEGDCDDTYAEINPGEPELPNGIDEDCDQIVDEGTANYDDDGDGYSEAEGDCNDDPATGGSAYPGAVEQVNNLDDDCDEIIDDETVVYDDDGDGYCEEPPCLNTTEILQDCNDENAGANPHPATTEAINGIDDNCNGLIDDGTAVFDDDGDGYSEADGDCDDTTIAKSPGNTEICDNGIDDDCDYTQNSENAINCTDYYFDGDNDSYGIQYSMCMCDPIDEYRAEIKYASDGTTPIWDCLDDANIDINADLVNPGQNGYFTSPYTDLTNSPSFDYDCNESEVRQYPDSGQCNSWTATIGDCTLGHIGWDGSVPACGQLGNLMVDNDSCSWCGLFCGCDPGGDTYTYTQQACR